MNYAAIWNATLEQRTQRTVESRAHLWASEIGKAPLDIWLRLRGEQPSNPPGPRACRKFEAGNVFEFIVKLVLQRVGMLKSSQHKFRCEYDGLLPVSGRMDFVMGIGTSGQIESITDFEALGLPEFMVRAATAIGKGIIEHYEEIPDTAIEVKSHSLMMFERLLVAGKPNLNHRMQLFAGMKGAGIERGEIIYICRDDCRMQSFAVANPGPTDDELKWAIAEISDYYRSGQQPPKEKEIVWNPDTGNFRVNWQIQYSEYLTLMYGYKDEAVFADKWKPTQMKWNRVLGRMNAVRAGKKTPTGKLIMLTPDNLEAVQEIKGYGYDAHALVDEFNTESEDES